MKIHSKHDSILEQKWSQKRVLYTDTNPYIDPGIDFTGDPGKTDQSQAAECDINNILKNYQRTGVLPNVNKEALYADVSNPVSYQEALDLVINAQNQFDALDAHTRQRFSNDPAEFLAFVDDPKNAQELVKLGLATLRPEDPTDRIVGAIKASKTPSKEDSDPAAGSRRKE